MISANLQQWIQHPEDLNRDTLYELRTLVARYPYFQSLRLLYLKNLYLLHDTNFGAELRKAVLYVADRRALFYLIEGDRYTLKPSKSSPVSPDMLEEDAGVDRTLSLIDAFLATRPEEQIQNNELDYAMDYTAYLLKEETAEPTEESIEKEEEEPEGPKLLGQELIDGFIRQTETIEQHPIETEVEPASEKPVTEEEEKDVGSHELSSVPELDESCFTETLAKIYVKQHRYDKALEIIKKLSLNNPKKNAYFADQIRFLEKLIINAKSE